MTDVTRLTPMLYLSAFVSVFLASSATAAAAPLVRFDFADPSTVSGWKADNDVASLTPTPEGMAVAIDGDDPFLSGPPVDLPADVPLWLDLRLRSDEGGTFEIFYFTDHARPGRSVVARVAPGEWQDVRVPLPPLSKGTRFRVDPPGAKGTATLASLAVRARLPVPQPAWPEFQRPRVPAGTALVVRSGDLELRHDGAAPAGFELRVGGEPVAAGMSRGLVGYVTGERVAWSPLPGGADVRRDGARLVEIVTWRDADGATWRIDRRYAPAESAGAIDVETRVVVDRDRDILFLPALVVLPGAGSFGSGKAQALFPGLEYLDKDEPSSSEADVTGPAAKRLVPDSLKVTFPLMAVCAGGRYIGLLWEKQENVAAVFDSPDRTFNAGGHAMGLLLPGSDGLRRVDGDLVASEPTRLLAGEPVTVRATLIGARGNSVVPAVQKYVALQGLPPLPDPGMSGHDYVKWAAGGWLDSKVREESKVRHAVWPGFGAGHAADAAAWMRWLASRAEDAELAGRLRAAADEVVAPVAPQQYDASAVGHVIYPAASLVFGHVEENAAAAEERGRRLLRRFEGNGSVHYRREEGKPDLGRTHFAPDANGLTAALVVKVLEATAVSGDAELRREGLRLLRALDKFAGTVPRGAQTWEVPLHTPDVLASAHLVRAYTLGYEMTGERALLDSAVYWAWTGVPFVYLDPPVNKPVGSYATIAVFGATNWVDVWFGRPVQWCGLVYADALYRLLRHDRDGPWKHIADGITLSGVQQSWPASDADRQGLLPDFYHLRPQLRDGPAINPATLQSCAQRLFAGPSLYDAYAFRRGAVWVHVPGDVLGPVEKDNSLQFECRGWPDGPYHILVSGLQSPPQVCIDGKPLAGDAVRYHAAEGRLALRVTGTPTVLLTMP